VHEGGEADILIEELGSYALRPRDFVYWAFPWGEAGTEFANRKGPEPWQSEVLFYLQQRLQTQALEIALCEAIQMAVRSGHNIGKSALVCWLIIWALSTREDTKGVVTANTEKQLRLKLWAELAKWHRLFIARQFFKVTATSYQASDPDREKEWRIDAIPWSEDNPEAFAGLHNYGKRIIVIFDEASGIADKIWETMDGVMNERDTEIIWLATGNPTRNTGRFRECFNRDGQGVFWQGFKVDSREVSFTNKERIQKAIDLWGLDSDYIKVRWLGEFPLSGNSQLISADVIRAAMARPAVAYPYEPLIFALDVARFGDNASVLVARRGKDAKSQTRWRWNGLSTTELGNVVGALIHAHSPDAVFVDEGGIGGGVIDFLRHLGHSIVGVHFGGLAARPLGGELAANKRAEMYLSLRHWLREGGAIEDDEQIFRELIAQEYGHQKRTEAILLTPKEDMDESPDWADALALTFAHPVSKRHFGRSGSVSAKQEYDPYSVEAIRETA
jgi:hypothetical protein